MSKKKDKNARKKAVKNKELAKKKQAKARALEQMQVSALDSLNYEITYEPIIDEDAQALPPKLAARKQFIYDNLRETPDDFIDELTALIIEYPQDDALGNYLANAYMLSGNEEQYKEFVKASYQAKPHYLFNRFQMANIYIAEGNFTEVYHVFAGKFDLKALYPERTLFHISEVTSMLAIAVQYYEWAEHDEQFLQCFDILREIEPMSPIMLRMMPRMMQLRFGMA